MKNTVLYQYFEDAVRSGDSNSLEMQGLEKYELFWRDEFRLYQTIRNTISFKILNKKKEEDFKLALKEISSDYFIEAEDNKHLKKSSYFNRYHIRLAAIFFLMIIVCFGIKFYAENTLSNTSIINDNPLFEQTIYRSAHTDLFQNPVKAAFADKNYHQVIYLMKDTDLKEIGKPDNVLMLGASYYYTAQYDKAIGVYQNMLVENYPYLDQIFLNIILCQIKVNNINDALKTLNLAITHPEVMDNEVFINIKKQLTHPLRKITTQNR